MVSIKLDKKMKIGDKDIDTVELNFDKVNGNMLMDCEKMARTMGEQLPQVMFSQTYQIALASKICELSYADILKLPGRDFQKIIREVANFLFAGLE